MNVLVTGGLGFIGSHTIVELLSDGHTVTVIDNFSNSDKQAVERLEKLTDATINFEELDVRNTEDLQFIMESNCIEIVIHFAALKAVGESVEKPLEYYRNNIDGLLSVLEAMNEAEVKKLIFSSSATVYGDPDELPITEDAPLKQPSNPYGATKQMAEQIIQDVCKTSDLQTVILRYFNPIGAHSSGLIGELPKGTPNNLIPFVTQAAAGIRDELTIYGDDWDTPDGYAVRDYIHVVDLAKAHTASLNFINDIQEKITILNIGTGQGASVLEIIETFEKVNNVKIPYKVGPRRDGDIAACYASPAKANKVLGWKVEKSLEDSLRDAWNWQQKIITD